MLRPRPPKQTSGAAAASRPTAALSDETLQRTLLLAQKFVDQTKRESEAEAAAVVAQAEETARAAIAAAEATAAQLQAESHQKLREEVTRLETTRTELATDVESMARHLESERNRLRGALSEILKWVDENVQPANSLMGVKPKQARSSRQRPGARRVCRSSGRPGRGGRRCADARTCRAHPAPPCQGHPDPSDLDRLTRWGRLGGCCPPSSRSGIVTRSPDEAVVRETGHADVVRRRER